MIGVVGDGLAGLVAGSRLTDAGRDVRVFGTAGGGDRLKTYETGGDRIEAFPQRFPPLDDSASELFDDLGLDDNIEWSSSDLAYYVDGVAHPFNTRSEFLAYPTLSMADKLRLSALKRGITVYGRRIHRNTYTDSDVFADVSVAEFFREHTSSNVYDYVFAPKLDAEFGDRTDDLSAAWLLESLDPRGFDFGSKVYGYPRGGVVSIIDALRERLGDDRIETTATVRNLSFSDEHGMDDDGGYQVDSLTVETESGAVKTHDVDAVVVATTPTDLQPLTGYDPDIECYGSICGVLSMEERLLDTHRLYPVDDAPFGALFEHTNFIPADRYGGERLLYVTRAVADSEDELWGIDDAELEHLWLNGIESLFPDFDSDDARLLGVSREPDMTTVYTPDSTRPAVPTALEDIGYSGVYYAGVGAREHSSRRCPDGAVLAGLAAVDRLLDES